ncbi:tRNA modification GTPase [Salinimicrobium soli]|uniref:tRNA modification GTPase n=1 Tax=Salinimicrobium soli TaxID=1254399 RepID=UPI003AAB3C62
MKHHLTTVLILLSFIGYSQTDFQKGYFISNTGEKVEGLIKNKDWKNNPEEISFKFSENAQVQTETIKTIKEFGIYGRSKYLRATVDIDKTSELLRNIDDNREPVFEEEQLFLKVLVEGKASLFSYSNEDVTSFLYQKGDSDIEELVFKVYLVKNQEIAENNYYKQQLINNLNCEASLTGEIKGLKYEPGSLSKFFIKYNKCENEDFQTYSQKDHKAIFNISLKAGIKNSSLEIMNQYNGFRNTDFGNQVGYRVGLEAEVVLPFHNNKWSVFVDPAYQKFLSTKETPNLYSEVTYHSIEVPIGVRHYMYLTPSSKLILSVMTVMDISFDSSLYFEKEAYSTLEIRSGKDTAVGFGYNYNNRYSAELRYYLGRDLMTNYGSWDSDYNTVALIFGYSLF